MTLLSDRNVRERSLVVIARCFGEALGARSTGIVSRVSGTDERLIASWSREPGEPPLPDARTRRRARERGAAVFGPGAGDGDGGSIVVAPFRTTLTVDGYLFAQMDPALKKAAAGWIADSYARIVALALSDDHALPAVLAAGDVDPLTGCLSYAGALDALGSEIERSRRGKRPLSVCMIDLDDFKAINDTHGHIRGNRVLLAVAETLQASARGYDSVGRFGGDEFVVILPETQLRDALSVARRLRETVRGTAASAAGVPGVELCAGVAEWSAKISAEELLDQADAALMNAKHKGGARVSAEAEVWGERTRAHDPGSGRLRLRNSESRVA